MRRVNFLFAFFLLNCFAQQAFAQNDSISKDSLLYHKVLLVQFDTMMYLSDAEHDIMEQSEKSLDAYRTYLRKSLDNKIAGEVEALLPCYSLLNDKSKQDAQTTGEIYGQCNYRYDDPMKLKHTKSPKLKPSKNNSKENEDSKVAPQYITVQGDAKYMNAGIENKILFEKLNKQYGADLFLFINQFEIKTNFNNCIDIARHVYKRELIISYSIYNKEGKQVDGNLAHAYFPSNSNRDSDIAERTFPSIATSIASHIQALVLNK